VHWELIEKISGANQTFAGVFRTHRAQRPTDKMADDTDAGLPVRQLLKMVASGDLSPAEFKQLTKHVIGPTHGAVRRNTVCHWCFFSLLCRQYSNILAILRGI
jgi:hypothetical protein